MFHSPHTSLTIFLSKRPVAYVDVNLVGTGKIAKAAILGQSGGIWANTDGYNVCAINMLSFPYPSIQLSQLTSQEQKEILTSHADPEKIQAHGLLLAEKKFFTLQANDRSIYLKKAVCPNPPDRSLLFPHNRIFRAMVQLL
jgi:hypothetical protein